jgi:hypothetical protein
MMACDHAQGDWAAVLRRRQLRPVEGRPEGGHTGEFEIICCACGDSPYLDYREVSPRLQLISRPYPFPAGATAYEEHLGLHRGQRAAS